MTAESGGDDKQREKLISVLEKRVSGAQREVEQLREEKEAEMAKLRREQEEQALRLQEAESAKEALAQQVKREKLCAAELKETLL